MPRRFNLLNGPGTRSGRTCSLPGALAIFLLLFPSSSAWAHRLDAKYLVLPDGKVRIESWFDIIGDSPKGAEVLVYGANDQLVVKGKLDAAGQFVFSLTKAEPLRVVVNAPGHRAILRIPVEALTPGATDRTSSDSHPPESPSSGPPPGADRSSSYWRDALIGIGFLLALSAFVLSIRNAQKLRAFGRQ